MEFTDWYPIYREIVKKFGFSESDDMVSCRILSSKIPSEPDLSVLDEFRGKPVMVIGNSPDVDEKLDLVEDTIHIVAGSAIVPYFRRFGYPDILVTDLDGDGGLSLTSMENSSVVFIHAHGDNIDAISSLKIKRGYRVFGTCQCKPEKNLLNFGGFTDGDRAVFLADFLGSSRITLVGFDWANVMEDSESLARIKMRKLGVARHLITDLRRRRSRLYGENNIIIL